MIKPIKSRQKIVNEEDIDDSRYAYAGYAAIAASSQAKAAAKKEKNAKKKEKKKKKEKSKTINKGREDTYFFYPY